MKARRQLVRAAIELLIIQRCAPAALIAGKARPIGDRQRLRGALGLGLDQVMDGLNFRKPLGGVVPAG
jgi:hypothetical protein